MSWQTAAVRWHAMRTQLTLPPRFARREYGFIQEGGRFIRHLAFGKRDELRKWYITRAPLHGYHSTAYYQTPQAPTMNEKGWLGADLIFDLDADHLPGGEGKPPWALITEVREETLKLVEQFLLDQFGFDKRDLRIVFSGNRGYHVHVHDRRVMELDAEARREIVDYVTASGVNVEDLVQKRTVARDGGFDQTAWMFPDPEEAGWRGHVARTAVRFIERTVEIADAEADDEKGTGEEAALARIAELPGVGKKSAPKVLAAMRRRGPQALKVLDARVLKGLAAHAKLLAEGETDEPVTADIKRLIRLPGTIHGKSGLEVKEIPLERLADYDPFQEALALPEDEVVLELDRPFTVPYGDGFEMEKGENRVPAYAAWAPVNFGFGRVKSGWLIED